MYARFTSLRFPYDYCFFFSPTIPQTLQAEISTGINHNLGKWQSHHVAYGRTDLQGLWKNSATGQFIFIIAISERGANRSEVDVCIFITPVV